MSSLLDNPKELIKFINDRIKPKKEEKRKYGEVFTPLFFINEMLDELGIYYGYDLFKDPNLKWFDPAVGIGNFLIIIYQRLMRGLKQKIPNKADRKKHIIENMLYASELNEKNCLIYQNIFNPRGEYTLNFNAGDSLELDIKKKWDLDGFDIIIGNPPYNKAFNENNNGAMPLYNYNLLFQVNGFRAEET